METDRTWYPAGEAEEVLVDGWGIDEEISKD
jgi:hypothetical protein